MAALHLDATALLQLRAGMYLGSAAAMLVLPSVAAAFGAASLLKVVGCLGLSWLALWLVVGKEAPYRCVCVPRRSKGVVGLPDRLWSVIFAATC